MVLRVEKLEIAGRLDVPPADDARLTLSDGFGTRFALFGDAEEEFDWNGPFRREATSTATIRALPDANRRFQAAGLQPCWMVDWPVVDNADSGAILRELVQSGAATVGTQLHPWVSPPFDEEVTRHNSYTANLPRDLQREKLRLLTERIKAVTGAHPRCYRAGRYGIGRHTASLLREFGYDLDVSVRAQFDYSKQGGPDFSSHPLWPYRVAPDLYEVPLSTGYTGLLRHWPALYSAESVRGSMARTRLLSRIPLTPEGVPLSDALDAIDALLDAGHRLFSLSFHTPSLEVGHTPYVRDQRDLATFWRWWDGVFDRFAARGVDPVGVDEIVDALKAADGQREPVPAAPITIRTRRRSDIVPIRDYVARPDPMWDALAARASSPNPFAERWFVEASVKHLDVPDGARMLAVRAEDQLIGLLPLVDATRYGRMTIPHLQNWMHYNCFFGAPLVRRSFEPYFWHRALELLDADPASPAFLHVAGLDAGDALTQALLAARDGAAIVHRSSRAMLASDLSPDAYYEAAVRQKKRKEIRRLRSRLAELGSVTTARLSEGADLDGWTDTFLALEAAGWKGARGAALANARDTEGFVRDALRSGFAAGRLEMLRLDLDGRAIAMLVNFLTPPGSSSFKIAFDEDYARFSPGVLIQIENLKILERPGIDWMDSCAVEDHPMINSLWRERRELVRVSVPLKGVKRRAVFAAARTLETASALARRAL